eukprot:364637-Chlamydomonas_euryale.AAC.17
MSGSTNTSSGLSSGSAAAACWPASSSTAVTTTRQPSFSPAAAAPVVSCGWACAAPHTTWRGTAGWGEGLMGLSEWWRPAQHVEANVALCTGANMAAHVQMQNPEMWRRTAYGVKTA